MTGNVVNGRYFVFQFQSLTNLPCGLESNNNIVAAGSTMDEEDASADDDEHIRRSLVDEERKRTRSEGLRRETKVTRANGQQGNGVVHGGGGASTGALEKFRIDYPKKYHNARSMSLSMERNAFFELSRVSRSSVPFDLDGGDESEDGNDNEPEADKSGTRRYMGFTLRQYMALGSLALVDFLGFCSMSVMAPTFPKEVSAEARGRV